MPTITSGSVTLLDLTDTKKIDLHISSNHPTVQIYNQNDSQEPLIPDWSKDSLILTPIIYMDSIPVINDSSYGFKWDKINSNGVTENEVSTSKILTVSDNDLNNSATMRYKCTVTTQGGQSFSNEITFARVYTGKDGVNGTDGYTPQKGVDYFDGIDGKDGTSVTIEGVAYSKTTPVTGKAILLYSDTATTQSIIGTATGESYLVNGYLCVFNADINQFVCTGQIQGPQGQKGDSYYLFIRYADNVNGSGISAYPAGKTYIGFYRSSVNQVPTDISATTWNWAKFVGDNAKTVNLTANAQVFKVNKNGVVSPPTITITAQAENTTVTSWYYNVDGSKNFINIADTRPTGVSEPSNGAITITGSAMTSNLITIKASDGNDAHSDIFTIYKVADGTDGSPGDDGTPASIAFLSNENMSFAANANGQVASTTVYCNVVAYKGTTKVTPELGTITGLPTGMSVTAANITTVSNEKVIPIVIANNATLGSANSISGSINIPITSPVATTLKLNWSKINTGVPGVGIKSTTVTYGVSDSASTRPADNAWQSTIPVVAEGKYLWTRTIIDYTDDATPDTITYTYAKQGTKGDTGSDGSSVTVKSIEYQAGTSATSAPTGTWSNNVVSVAEGSYLWTKTTFSDNKIAYGVAKQGEKGSAGTNASLVNITPSAMYFKSTTGKDGTFTPEFIYLYPRFQNVVYSNWQYSIDGGVNWVSVSGANGLAVSTYSSIPNTLRISRASTLYTDTVTSISFRCNSATSGVYDTVSVAKIYDVVDLQIGGRNLLLNTGFDGTNKKYSLPSSVTSGEGGLTFTLSEPLSAGTEIALKFQVRGLANINAYWIMTGGNVSQTAILKNKISATNFSAVELRYTIPSGKTLNSIFICTAYGNSTPGTDWFEIKAKSLKLELGNTFTDWTPAPEDIDTNIETLTNSIVDIGTTANSAVSRVTETEKSITTINNNITSLTNKVSAAEQKITADAIVSTVTKSTTYTSDLGKKVNSTEIISKINQTAEAITISASKIGILGATNIPDLTADKIKGGTLTLGGSSATTQNGQLLVKNASNSDVVKLNKDGVIVKSGHLAVAEDFTNQTYNWEDESWTTTINTSQLDLGDDFIRMGVYSPSGYNGPLMMLSDTGLSFQGRAQGVGGWGSFIGHHWDQLDFVIQDTVRSNISFRGSDDEEMAKISGEGFYVNGPVSGGITSGNARQWSNVFTKNFPSQHTGYIAIRLGTITRAANSMMTIKGHVTSYHNSSTFEASCYFYSGYTAFYGTVATMSNPDVLKEVYFAEGVSDGCVYLILGGSNSSWSYPTVAIDNLTVGYSGNTAYEWNSGWTATLHTNLSSFKTVTACARGGMKVTLWSGVAGVGQTLTLHENLRNFKFLTCIMGTTTEPYGITMGTFLDDEVAELHFSASFTATNGRANSNVYGAKFTIPSSTSITLVGCGTIETANLSVRKIVGWR